jgi:hypothetical protein
VNNSTKRIVISELNPELARLVRIWRGIGVAGKQLIELLSALIIGLPRMGYYAEQFNLFANY